MRNPLNPPKYRALLSLSDQWADGQSIRDFTEDSAYKARWKCDKSHTWNAAISDRVKGGNNCPYCGGRRVWVGFNDIPTTHPHLAKEWNDERDIFSLTAGSHYEAEWKCADGHSWKTQVKSRSKYNRRCPYCAGQRAIVGVNDLATTHPHIANQWADERPAQEFMAGSNKKALWECSEGHQWEALISSRTNAKTPVGCPYCSGRFAIRGKNDIKTTHPHLIEEWDDKRDMADFLPNSRTRVKWRCPIGHSYVSLISGRCGDMKSGCPYCAGTRVIPGKTDLPSTHPHLVKEWDDKRDIHTVSAGSGYKAQWKCDEGHSWDSVVHVRAALLNPTGCPTCWAGTSISKVEKELFAYISSVLPGEEEMIQSNRTVIAPSELDIYIPGRQLAIEFNGIYWHTEGMLKSRSQEPQTYHYNKWKKCQDKGIQLISIWEDDWRDKRHMVEKMLLDKLFPSKPRLEGLYASTVSTALAKTFNETHGIHGHAEGNHIGFYEEGELVAIASWFPDESGTVATIMRVSSSAPASNVFTAVMSATTNYLRNKGFLEVRAVSNNTTNEAVSYEQHGFKKVSDVAPDYMYLKKESRASKETVESLKTSKGQEMLRIWDCGKTVWATKI